MKTPPLGPILYPHPPLSYGSHQSAAAMVALLALALLTAALATNTSGAHITATQIVSGTIFFLSAGRLLFVFYKEKVLDPEKKMVEYALAHIDGDASKMDGPTQYLRLTQKVGEIKDPAQRLIITYALCCLELRRLPNELRGMYHGRLKEAQTRGTHVLPPLFADAWSSLWHLDDFFTSYHQLKSQGKVTEELRHLHNDLIDKLDSWFSTSAEQEKLDDAFRRDGKPWRQWWQMDDQPNPALVK